MPEAGFEPTITASERAKTVHVLDSSSTVTGKGERVYAPAVKQHIEGTILIQAKIGNTYDSFQGFIRSLQRKLK
jgi:hypothetical protein